MRLSLKYKLLILLTSISSTALAGYALLALWDFKEDKLANIFSLNVLIADSVSAQVNKTLQNHIQDLHRLVTQFSASQDRTGAQQTSHAAELTDFKIENSNYSQLWVYKWHSSKHIFYPAFKKALNTPQAKTTESSPIWTDANVNAILRRTQETDLAYKTNPNGDDWLLGVKYKNRETGDPIIVIAQAINNPPLKTDSTIAQNVYLIDDHGEVLAHNNPLVYPLANNEIASFLDAGKQQVGNFAGVAEVQTSKLDPWYISLTPVGYGQLYILAALPKGAALKPVLLLAIKSVIFFLIIASIAIIFALFGAHSLTLSLRVLRDAMVGAGRGEFDQTVEIKSKDEVGQLAGTFNHMTMEIKKLLNETKSLARMEEELKTAQLVQSTLFPVDTLDLEQIRIRGRYEPASECSGDWWSYQLSETQAYLWIGDATGHGVPAALVTSAARSATSILEKLPNAPLQTAMSLLNHAIYTTTKGKVNMTFFAGRLDLQNKILRYTNASHDPPYLLRRTDGKMKKKDLMPLMGEGIGKRLGQQDDSEYFESEIQLYSGDRIIFYTDGLTELHNPQKMEFGEGQFLRKLVESYNQTHDFTGFFDQLNGAIDSYRENAALNDDLTYFVIEIP